MKFSQLAKEKLGFYVYGLVDPRDNRIFYVGKASANNRAFDHFKASKKETKKSKLISEIRAEKHQPEVEILRYGLESQEIAFEVEAAIIDAFGLENLTNHIRGHGIEKGRISAKKAQLLYDAKSKKRVSEVDEQCIIFYIKDTYSPTLSEQEMYDSTRQFWTVSKEERTKRSHTIALGVVDGVVVRVYSIAAWFDAGTTFSSRSAYSNERGEFVGQLQNDHPLLGCLLVDDDDVPIPNQQKGFSYLPMPK